MKRQFLLAIGVCIAVSATAHAKTFSEMFGKDSHYEDKNIQAIVETLDYKQGRIRLPSVNATLDVPEGFYFLDSKDAETVLFELWGNTKESSTGSLGMLFPASTPPASADTWGSVVEYYDEGYVSDVDAATTDYGALLKDMQQQTEDYNAERRKQNASPIHLVGWAEPPHYDSAQHAVHWARDLVFDDDFNKPHTLNYSVRILGREGIVALNFIGGLDQLEVIKKNIPATLAMTNFDPGKGYNDHAEGDKIAAYGLAGLIAAGAGAKIAAKLGFLAFGLVLLKKAGLLILVPLAAIAGWIKRMVTGKHD